MRIGTRLPKINARPYHFPAIYLFYLFFIYFSLNNRCTFLTVLEAEKCKIKVRATWFLVEGPFLAFGQQSSHLSSMIRVLLSLGSGLTIEGF